MSALPLPPFDQVITRFDLRAEEAGQTFDVTRGHRSSFSRVDRIESSHLPDLTVGLGQEAPLVPDAERVDLQVSELIGRGGMGEVWLARQRSLGRDVALKMTAADADGAVDQTLIAEARITGALEHPSIVPVHALGRAPSGRPVLVMKRIEGVAWRDLLRAPDHPHWADLGSDEPLIVHIQILMQLCHALELSHRRGIVHRDIKPANVMVGSFGEVYLVDWGLAVAIDGPPPERGRLEGTPAYMAPEMLAGLPVDARTDVYLLGATLHEVLTGAPPHVGRTLAEVLRHAYDAGGHDYGDAPAELVSLCRQAMSRDPAARPAGARAFRDRLAAFLDHRASSAIGRRGQELLTRLGQSSTPSPQRRALLEECLVTLRLALAEWPENPSARAALDQWRRIALSIEVEAGHLAAARHLIEQMDDPPSELTAMVAELEERVARERREADRGRRATFEGDVRVGARERKVVSTLMTLGVLLVATFALPHAAQGTLDALAILIYSLVPFLAFVLLVAVLRHRLFGNVFARRTIALIGLLLALTLAHRTVAWLVARPANETLVAELLMFAGTCGAGGIVLARWWFVGLAAALVGGLLCTWKPALAGLVFTATALLIALVGIVASSRDAQAGES